MRVSEKRISVAWRYWRQWVLNVHSRRLMMNRGVMLFFLSLLAMTFQRWRRAAVTLGTCRLAIWKAKQFGGTELRVEQNNQVERALKKWQGVVQRCTDAALLNEFMPHVIAMSAQNDMTRSLSTWRKLVRRKMCLVLPWFLGIVPLRTAFDKLQQHAVAGRQLMKWHTKRLNRKADMFVCTKCGNEILVA